MHAPTRACGRCSRARARGCASSVHPLPGDANPLLALAPGQLDHDIVGHGSKKSTLRVLDGGDRLTIHGKDAIAGGKSRTLGLTPGGDARDDHPDGPSSREIATPPLDVVSRPGASFRAISIRTRRVV